MKKLILTVFLVGIFFVAGFAYYIWNSFVTDSPSNDATEVVYEVGQGRTFTGVAVDLESKGLIKDAKLFRLYARFVGKGSKLKVGEYALRRNMTPQQVLNTLSSGVSIGRTLTISEGLNIFEISELYQAKGFGTKDEFLNVVLDKTFIKSLLGEEHDSLEGYLYPETYSLTKYSTTKTLVTQMVQNFQRIYNEVIPNSEIKGLTKHQIVTLASIVEKETGAAEERPIISSVFHNRLAKGMMLQTDPTILYGIAQENRKVILKIGREDIRRPTRYNTYVIKGLPPGPIANPGREALLATVKPDSTDFLFFVSENDGTHVFSTNYEAHNAAVKKFQVNPNARKGKSWRDLNKKKPEAQTP